MMSTSSNIFQFIADVSDYANGAESLRRLHIDNIHLDPVVVASMGWRAIHAENDGQLEDEEFILVEHLKNFGSTNFYTTTLEKLREEKEKGKFKAIHLNKVTQQDLRAIQLGINFAEQPHEQEQAYLSADITFYASTSFDRPLSFVMLREAEGYGWTTIAGSPALITAIENQSHHQVYSWRDGVLPLHIAGASDPRRR